MERKENAHKKPKLEIYKNPGLKIHAVNIKIMSLMRIQGNIVNTPRYLGSMLV